MNLSLKMTEKNAGFIFLQILEFEAKLDWKVVFFFFSLPR